MLLFFGYSQTRFAFKVPAEAEEGRRHLVDQAPGDLLEVNPEVWLLYVLRH